MHKPKVHVLWFPGVNCHLETQYAFNYVGAKAHIITIFQALAGKVKIEDCDELALAGGFSMGDHIRAGVIAAMVMISKFRLVFQKMIDDGKPIIGICNGYQELAASGLLDRKIGHPTFLLDRNLSGTYDHRMVKVCIHHHPGCSWTEGNDGLIFDVIVGHGEGNLVKLASEQEITWKVAATYGSPEGIADYPISPSGSRIAGISNGNVFGWFPHQERNMENLYPIFEAGVRAVK